MQLRTCFQTGSVLNKVQNFQNKSVLIVHGSADGKPYETFAYNLILRRLR